MCLFDYLTSAENVSLQVRDCVQWYTCDWSVVVRKYREHVMSHQGQIMKIRQRTLAVTNQKMYEVDEEDSEECTTVSFILLDSVS